MNVGENWPLTDTVIIGTNVRDEIDVPGWYTTLNDLGQANKLTFFNQRTRAIGLPYCNLDTRDQLPYPFIIKSIGVRFWATCQTETKAWAISPDVWTSNYVPHIFMVDIPRHCKVEMQIQQDVVLKNNAMMLPAGYGPCGGGYGQTSPSSQFGLAVDKSYSAVTQNTAHLSNRFHFATWLKVPRNAAMKVELQFSEYAKQLLQTMVKYNTQDVVEGAAQGPFEHQSKTFYGIQVTLMGERLVQQRGKWHA